MDPTLIGLLAILLGFSTIGITAIGLKIVERITQNDSLKCCICKQEIKEINEKYKTN